MNLESLRPYQHTGAAFLAAHPQALLADDMGLGKSCQVVRASDLVGADNILVLCPGGVRVGWAREFEKFSPMDRPCTVLFSSDDSIPASGVVICSYDLLAPPSPSRALKAAKANPDDPKAKAKAKQAKQLQERRKAFLRAIKFHPWDLLVLDEAHFLKDPGAGRTTAVFGRNVNDPGIAGNAARIWRLTGTPAPNDVSELWIHLRSAGIIDWAFWDFAFHFCSGYEGEYGWKATGTKNETELKALLAQFMLRREKDEVLDDLPPIRFEEVAVERSEVKLDSSWGPAAAEDIRVGEQTLAQALAAIARPDDQLAVLEAQSQSMSTLRRYTGLAKLPAIMALVKDELESGALDKIVLFGVHQAVVEGAAAALAKFGSVLVYGKTPQAQRQGLIDRFAKDSTCRVFVGNIQAAGIGINGLQDSCCEVGFLEQEWVPGPNAQAAMRVHRFGQTRPVRGRVFSLYGSTDIQVQTTLLRKVRELTKIF